VCVCFEGQMTLTTTLMRVLHHPVTLRIPPLLAIMRTLCHHRDHTILRLLAVLTPLTRAIPVPRRFPTRVILFFNSNLNSVLHVTFYFYSDCVTCCILLFFLSVSTVVTFFITTLCLEKNTHSRFLFKYLCGKCIDLHKTFRKCLL